MSNDGIAVLNPSSSKKIVLITGSSSGIGKATAIAFAKAGFSVIATIRNKNKEVDLYNDAKNAHVAFDIRLLDVCDDQSVNECIANVLKDYGHIDILLNNAGTGYRGTLEHTPLDDFKKMMDVNYYSVVRLIKAVFPSMRERGSGHIITVSSLGGLIGVPFCEAYCAAKFAVEGLMESFAPIAQSFGVAVSMIEPGPVKTNFLENVIHNQPQMNPDPYMDLEQAYLQSLPERFAAISQTPDEIAAVILNAAKADAPHFRYPSSEPAKKHASGKYVDITGNTVVNAIGQLILKKSNAL